MSSEPLPQKMVLRQPKKQTLWLLLGFFALAVVIILRVPVDMTTPVDGVRLRWGIGIVAGMILLAGFFGSFRTLTLDMDGFQESDSHLREWRRCSEFAVETTRVRKLEFEEVVADSDEYGKVTLRGSYDRSCSELAALMNRFRARSLGLNA
jgi:hypothetical protein